jgi:RNA ligase (TIGR02306 family)
MTRKLASVQRIQEIQEIPNADAIVAIRVLDWWCVAKKDEFKVGDFAVYFEIDSLLPMTDTFAFMASRGTKATTLDDGTTVFGYRLKTAKLRGQISQGLALPITILPENDLCWDDPEGVDVTKLLGVHKYEAPDDGPRSQSAKGYFPSFIRKTDQERCQNLRRSIWDAYCNDTPFQVTYKLDGSSLTFYKHNESTGVCSRNLDLKDEVGNQFWDAVRDYVYSDKIQGLTDNIAIQGELVGPKIQQNFEGVTKNLFFVYSAFDITKQCYIDPGVVHKFCNENGLLHVPIMHESITLKTLFPSATQDTIISELLKYAEGLSGLNGKTREGLVYKSLDGTFSFKTISNLYLLKHEK